MGPSTRTTRAGKEEKGKDEHGPNVDDGRLKIKPLINGTPLLAGYGELVLFLLFFLFDW